MSVTTSLTLDVRKRTGRVPQEVVVRQGESGTEVISAQVTKDGEAYASSCSSARLDVLHADGAAAHVEASKSGSAVTATLPASALSSCGLARLAHFTFYNSSNSNVETTEDFMLRVLPRVPEG